MVGCDCAVCHSTNPRNHRTRCSVLIHTPRGNILIDTPPDLRLQLLREKIQAVHAVLFTHSHADHVFGLDDLRPFPKILKGPVPLYCTAEVEAFIRRAFSYAFDAETASMPAGYLPKLTFERIAALPFAVLGQTITPIPLIHGPFHVLGFRIGDVAYCTDVSRIPAESWPRLEGVRVLIVDGLRHKPHPGHFCLDEALEVIARLKPERAYLTHTTHDLDYNDTNRMLPQGVELAYDGLRFEF